MPKLTGIFERFPFLEEIPLLDITRWLKVRSQAQILENFLANRLLYPQTIPASSDELEIDLAILREAVRRHPEIVYNQPLKKMIIEQEFEKRFPTISRLVVALVEALNPGGIISVFRKNEAGNILIGSIVSPAILPMGEEVAINLEGQVMQIPLGSIHVLPVRDRRLKFKLGSLDEVVVNGGDLGIVVDLRRKEELV